MIKRSSGILMHISSLPSPYGIGTMGKEAREFVDFLARTKQSYWQTLPICPTSYGDSPYSSFSTYAGNPYFIDLDLLCEKGLLKKADYQEMDWGDDPGRVDYGRLYERRFPVLKTAVRRFARGPEKNLSDFWDFCEDNAFWLEDYALFMTLKEIHGGKCWLDWDRPFRNRGPEAIRQILQEKEENLFFWKAVQYFFFSQWRSLHDYCREKEIGIIGDLPFYVALDSVDVWAFPELFLLDENRLPLEVAGVPPDGFSADGQLWGNPVYRWEEHRRRGYDWWIRRIDYLCRQYDILRIDHFRGFDSFYSVAYGEKTAKNGKWNPGPGMDLFSRLEEKIGKRQIIAEDLGYTTDSVRKLLKDTGFPGMKILQFGFDKRDAGSLDHRPHVYPRNCIAYIGTHDNDTARGWLDHAAGEDVAFAKDYLRLTDPERFHLEMIRALFATAADLTIVQIQDLLGLGSETRMNTPSTMGGNWSFRVKPGELDRKVEAELLHMTQLYQRD